MTLKQLIRYENAPALEATWVNGFSRRCSLLIGNAMGNDPELTRAMVVGIGFSYKRKKK